MLGIGSASRVSILNFYQNFPQPGKAKAFDPLRPDFKSWGSPPVFQGPREVPWGPITEHCRSPVISSAAHSHCLSVPQVTMHSKEPRHSSWGTASFLRPVPKLGPPTAGSSPSVGPGTKAVPSQYLLSDKQRNEHQLVSSLELLLRFLVQVLYCFS